VDVSFKSHSYCFHTYTLHKLCPAVLYQTMVLLAIIGDDKNHERDRDSYGFNMSSEKQDEKYGLTACIVLVLLVICSQQVPLKDVDTKSKGLRFPFNILKNMSNRIGNMGDEFSLLLKLAAEFLLKDIILLFKDLAKSHPCFPGIYFFL